MSDLGRLERRVADLERENAALRDRIAARQIDDETFAALESLLVHAPVGFAFFDRELRFVRVNEVVARINGLPLEAHLGRPIREIAPVNARIVEPVIEQVFRTGEPVVNLEIAGEAPANPGERRTWLAGFYPVKKPDGAISWVGIVVVDITEEKRIEAERRKLFEALELERARLASIFLQAPAFIATVRGPEHVFELANPRYYQLVGDREILGKPVREALPEIEGQGFFELLDEVYATGKPFAGNGIPVLVRHEEAGALEERFLNFVYQPLTEADGTVSGIFVHGVDITEQVRTAQELREAGRKKDEFLAMLGHELRNPLAPIRNAVQILRQAGHHEPVLEKARGMIDRQVSHMTRLVDDLLDVSRISRGKVLLHRERLDLTKLVRDTVEDQRRDLEAGGLTLDLELPAEPLWVEGDAIRLAQALGNLLSNAGKFTDPGGRVRVELEGGGDRESAEVVVEDTGIGIEPEMLENLFETFSQADRTLARSRGGLGLGLALVKGLMDLHGGEVEAASAGLGRGSRFTLRLPLAAAQEALEEEAAPPASANGSRRVLIIEDNADAAESLQMLLELSGFEVTTAADGTSGLETARRFHPDVVLCDIGLPGGLDGYGVARELRADSALQSVRLIALTGYGQAEDQRRAYAEGFDLHLTKPVDPVRLKDLLAGAPRPT
ncbi:MAG TPA: PAS domain-containing protein [Thermoanaerobaculia bacterium]|nr:PAS domain-containing protein [Thermoanaerobaculia bacterium]